MHGRGLGMAACAFIWLLRDDTCRCPSDPINEAARRREFGRSSLRLLLLLLSTPFVSFVGLSQLYDLDFGGRRFFSVLLLVPLPDDGLPPRWEDRAFFRSSLPVTLPLLQREGLVDVVAVAGVAR